MPLDRQSEWPPPWYAWSAPCPRCGEDVKANASDGWRAVSIGHRCADETIKTNPKMRVVELVRRARIPAPAHYYTGSGGVS